MIRNQPHPTGEHYRVIYRPYAPAFEGGPYICQRGAWRLAPDLYTGRTSDVFVVAEESAHATNEAAYAAIPAGAVVDRFDAAALVESFGNSV